MKLPVHKSAPVTTILTSPNGKIRAPIIRIKPGAFSWYQGAVSVLKRAAQAKESRQPAIKDDARILSMRMFAIMTPAREQSSTVSLGE